MYVYGSILQSMLITWCKRGVATWPRPTILPATRHKVGAHTFGIVSPESMLVKVQFRDYYDSVLLWHSRLFVATTDAEKWNETDIRYCEIDAITIWHKFCETAAS